jgi:hypothetical protein
MISHNKQNIELHDMNQRLEKAFGLEETVKRQEVVIEKLEGFINRLIRENRSHAKDPEYVRVRADLDVIRVRIILNTVKLTF